MAVQLTMRVVSDITCRVDVLVIISGGTVRDRRKREREREGDGQCNHSESYIQTVLRYIQICKTNIVYTHMLQQLWYPHIYIARQV